MALQLGHRKSVDLDFFGNLPVPSEEIRQILADQHHITVIQESKNINIYQIDGIKVDFVNYRYSWIDSLVEDQNIRLAGVKDIAAMKIAAIIGRGTKKDFIDLYYLLKRFSIEEILNLYLQKYPDGSMFIALKSLSYFGDAESDPMPYMFRQIKWATIEKSIQNTITEYIKNHQ